MHDMVVQAMDGLNEVADELGVERDLEAECVFYRTDRGQGVDGGADTADSLDEKPRITGVTTLQDRFQAAEHLAGRPGLGDFSAINFNVYP